MSYLQTSDYDQVRGFLGITAANLSDTLLGGLVYLRTAEIEIRRMIDEAAAQTQGASPTTAQIFASPDPLAPATADDKTLALAAIAAYVSTRWLPGGGNTLVTSVKSDDVQVVFKGAVLSPQEQEAAAMALVNKWLVMITNWPVGTQTLFQIAGPSTDLPQFSQPGGVWFG